MLIALCRPFKDNDAFATPATNQQIAAELFLSVDAVKGHLRTLFAKFGVDELPQMQKRVRAAGRAGLPHRGRDRARAVTRVEFYVRAAARTTHPGC